jgi:hypothetical protein
VLARALKWALVVAAGLVAVAVAGLAALPWLLDMPRLQAYVALVASQAVGRPVRFASISVSAFPLPTVRIRGLAVAEDPRFGTGAFLTVDDGRVAIRLRPLLLGRVELGDVALDGLRLSLVEAGGQWNLATLGVVPSGRVAVRSGGAPAPTGSAGAAAAGLGRVRIANGAVHYRRAEGESGGLRFEIKRLEITPGRRADTLAITGEAESRPGHVRLSVVDGALVLPPSRLLADASVRAELRVAAPDLRPVAAAFLDSTELTGALEGTVKLRGTLGRLAGEGELRAARVVLAQARPRCGPPARRELVVEDVRLPVSFALSRVDVAPAQARAAGGTVSLRLALRLSPSPLATVTDVAVRSFQLEPLLAGYACQPYAVSGPLELTGEASLAPADPWRTLAAQGRFRVGRGRLVGASLAELLRQAMALERRSRAGLMPEAPAGARGGAGATAAGPATFDAIAGSYRVAGGVVSSSDLEYESGDLRASGTGTYRLEDGWVDAAVTLARGASRVRARVSGAPSTVAIAPIGVIRGEASLPPSRLDRAVR